MSAYRRSKGTTVTVQRTRAEITSQYIQGMTIRRLMRAHHCCYLSIVTILDEAGVERRRSGYHVKLPEGRARLSEFARKRVREKNPRWKGGIHISHGVRFILKKEHPCADKQGYVREHRLVMEEILSRFLRSEEVIHHVNGDTLDNRPGNLMLFPNNVMHKKHHARLRKSISGGRLALPEQTKGG